MCDKEYSVALFNSRNKDNRNIIDFKSRKQVILVDSTMSEDSLIKAFYDFVGQGVDGEVSRFYLSVNQRNYNKVKKALLIKLIQDDNIKLTDLNSLVCSVAMKPENASEKKWLFDLDDAEKVDEFLADLLNAANDNLYELYKTPNGCHVIVEHGFDCRQLLEKYKDCVELKRDGMRYITSLTNINKK